MNDVMFQMSQMNSSTVTSMIVVLERKPPTQRALLHQSQNAVTLTAVVPGVSLVKAVRPVLAVSIT